MLMIQGNDSRESGSRLESRSYKSRSHKTAPTVLIVVLLSLAALLSGCQPGAPGPLFADGSETPNLSVTPDGHIILSWTEQNIIRKYG